MIFLLRLLRSRCYAPSFFIVVADHDRVVMTTWVPLPTSRRGCWGLCDHVIIIARRRSRLIVRFCVRPASPAKGLRGKSTGYVTLSQRSRFSSAPEYTPCFEAVQKLEALQLVTSFPICSDMRSDASTVKCLSVHNKHVRGDRADVSLFGVHWIIDFISKSNETSLGYFEPIDVFAHTTNKQYSGRPIPYFG